MSEDQDANVRRMKAWMAMFEGLTIQDIAAVGKISRPTVSGLLAGRPEVRANGMFNELERNPPTLVGIATRHRAFFTLDGVPIQRAEAAGRSASPDAKD